MKSVIVFFHMEKTGGTTLNSILFKEYGKKSVFMYRASNRRVKVIQLQRLCKKGSVPKVITGQVGCTIGKYLPPDYTPVYLTLLRRPVDRYISHLAHYFRNIFAGIREHKDRIVRLTTMDNYMVRMLNAGVSGKVTSVHLKKALKKVKRMIYGFTEKFDDFFSVLRKLFNWVVDTYELRRVYNSYTMLGGMLSEKVKKSIEVANKYDLELYQEAIANTLDNGNLENEKLVWVPPKYKRLLT